MLKKIFKGKKNLKILNEEVDLNSIREIAEQYYMNGDFYCSEAVLKVVKDAFKAPYGDDIIKLASGFPVGLGGSGCTCGAVNGGVMAISMFFGRELPGDKKVKKSMDLTKELYDEFAKKYKVACCKVLTRGMTLGSSTHKNHCVTITGDLAVLTSRILARELGYKIIEEN
ncbi:MAG: C-GCAxxG-C-C family protein [Cetobacterium sp.]|nr:C-GCAxxG-C-C family protein [Cetobacterium sp.]